MLILAYLGQGARIILDPLIVSNTFYKSIPDNNVIYWITFVLATLATIIASQAMISATFSLVYQAMQLDCFPRVKVRSFNQYIYIYLYLFLFLSSNFNLNSECIFFSFLFKGYTHFKGCRRTNLYSRGNYL